MTREEAIEAIKCNWPDIRYTILREALDMAVKALEDVTDKNVEKMTNADRIRAMSDEAIAEYVCRNSINTLCDIICGGECNAIATLKKSGDWACKEIVMKWLQQPAGEEDKHEAV